jgi:hypothetical protein
MNKAIKATHEGKLEIGETVLNVAVLEGGIRVISRNAIFRAFGRTKRGRGRKETRVPKMPAFLDAKNLQPFVGADLKGVLKQIEYIDLHGKKDSGYNALILPMLCKVYLDARATKSHTDRSVLTKSQEPLARASEILLLGLSNVGIIALVDEATGYQAVREKDALRQFLEKFLLEEKGKWIKTYPDEFFEMIFKMKGLTWTTANKGQKPQWIGHHINDFVYSRIAPMVLNELKIKNPSKPGGGRAAKHTQFIAVDYGHPKLKEHLAALLALGKAAGYNWTNFKRNIERAFPKFNEDGSQAPELGLPEEDK